jgi:hypothetical protein
MVKLTTSRSRLDTALADPTLTILLIAGSASVARDIHDAAEQGVTQPWRIVFLVIDTHLLTAAERQAWLEPEPCYSVLGGAVPKAVAESGPCADLLRTDGTPSILSIRQAFARGDQL